MKFNSENVEVALQNNPNINPYILLNKISHYDLKDAEDLTEFIHQAIPDYKILKSRLGSRKDYKKAFSEGKSVTEYSKSSAAAKEIKALADEIKEIIGGLT